MIENLIQLWATHNTYIYRGEGGGGGVGVRVNLARIWVFGKLLIPK